MFCDTPETLLHRAEGHVWEFILPKSLRSEELSGVSSMLQTREGIKVRQVSEEKPFSNAVSVEAALEAVPLFQGRSGSWLAGVLFFVMYIVCISLLVDDPQGVMARFFDMTGFVWLKDSIDRSVYSVTGRPARVALGVHQDIAVSHRELSELFFQPLPFTRKRVWEKGVMIVGGIVIGIAASVILPRYESGKKPRMVSGKKRRNTDGHGLFATEVIQTLRNCSVPWAAVMSGLWLSMFLADRKTAYGTLWVLAMMWSCLLYADYGCREKKYNMDTLLPTFYHAHFRQMLTRWCSGAMISVLLSVPVILRAALAGNLAGAAAGILSACFVVTRRNKVPIYCDFPAD